MVSIENIIFLLLFICFLENFTEKDLWKESFHLIHNRYIIKLYHDERYQTMSWTTFITSPRLQSGDAFLFYVSFSLLLFLFFHTFLSARFLGDALIKLHETLQEYHMPCEVVLLRVDFFKMAAVAMETAKMLKNWNTQKWSKQVTRRTEIDETWYEQHPHLVKRDKTTKSESVGQTLPQLPWKQKKGDLKKIWIPFMKLCWNIH